jgi:cysteine desulfurase / selenocysteine lyase
MSGLFAKDLFIGLEGDIAHLCTGGEAPVLKAAHAALDEFCRLKATGMPGRERFYERYAETKEMLARLLGVGSGQHIAFLNNASDGINLLARSLDWKPGDNVVSLAREFPSSTIPFLVQQRLHGVTVHVVEPGDDPEAAIAAAVNERTRVIMVSLVGYWAGLRVDLERLSAIARSCGALLVVDASHSLGVVPVPAKYADMVVSCCYKFLLATHGAGVCYISPSLMERLPVTSAGFHSVHWPSLEERKAGFRTKEGAWRLELGNPSFISVFMLNASLKLILSVSPEVLEAHVLSLGAELRQGIVALGLPLTTPEEARRRGPNVAFGTTEDRRIVRALAERNVLAWSDDNRVRFSFHGYNDRGDVARALGALREVV